MINSVHVTVVITSGVADPAQKVHKYEKRGDAGLSGISPFVSVSAAEPDRLHLSDDPSAVFVPYGNRISPLSEDQNCTVDRVTKGLAYR